MCAHKFHHWFQQLSVVNATQCSYQAWHKHHHDQAQSICFHIHSLTFKAAYIVSSCQSTSNTQGNQSWQRTKVGNSHYPSVPNLGSQKVEAETYLICESIKTVRTFSPFPYVVEAISVCQIALASTHCQQNFPQISKQGSSHFLVQPKIFIGAPRYDLQSP